MCTGFQEGYILHWLGCTAAGRGPLQVGRGSLQVGRAQEVGKQQIVDMVLAAMELVAGMGWIGTEGTVEAEQWCNMAH